MRGEGRRWGGGVAAACGFWAVLALGLRLGAAADPAGAASPEMSAERLVRFGLALGDHSDRERDYYLRALEARPDYVLALYYLADLHRARGEADEALRRYMQALAADPSFSIGHFGLADFLWHTDVDPSPAEGAEPRVELSPKVRRLELARFHFQRYLDLAGKAEGEGLLTESRLMLAQVEDDIAEAKNSRPVPYINWEEAARRLMRPADPNLSPYEGPRIPLAVVFEKGSSLVAYESTYLLDAVARALESKDLEGATVLIEGHADSSGDVAANLALSRQRAQSVRDYFVSRGLRAERFQIAGRGEGQPIVPNYTEELRLMNRRIEVVNWSQALRARGRARETVDPAASQPAVQLSGATPQATDAEKTPTEGPPERNAGGIGGGAEIGRSLGERADRSPASGAERAGADVAPAESGRAGIAPAEPNRGWDVYLSSEQPTTGWDPKKSKLDDKPAAGQKPR